VDYDSNGARVFEIYKNPQGSWTSPRHDAGEYFTLDAGRADFHIFAFGEAIAYKRKTPFNPRAAETWGLPWGSFEPPPPLALALLLAFGLGCVGLVAVRRDCAPGFGEHPALGTLSLVLVVALVVPPLPAHAGGGTNVLYRRWILGDHLGSATVILEANPQQPGSQEGRAERQVVYKPFGAIHQAAGSQGMDTDVFAGHPREPTTDLHYMRSRWQNPTTGTFLSVDPLVGAGGDPRAYLEVRRTNEWAQSDAIAVYSNTGSKGFGRINLLLAIDRGDGHLIAEIDDRGALGWSHPFVDSIQDAVVSALAGRFPGRHIRVDRTR
jgi:RHS repeat-associated protein